MLSVLAALAAACFFTAFAWPARATAARTVPNVASAWGFNEDGELGDGARESSALPVQVPWLRGVIAMAAGSHHSLALLRNGTVMAWGENFYGQLGDGMTQASVLPIAVHGLRRVVAIAAGEHHSLALLKNGTVLAWGQNDSGQLGDGERSQSVLPVKVSGLRGVKAISAGGSFSLALLRTGVVRAWGENAHGQLGDGSRSGSPIPVTVSGLRAVTAISAGFRHSLALGPDRNVVAWGDNEYGQLGNGSETASDVPVQVASLSAVAHIAAGKGYSLASEDDGLVMAWGDNEQGQLGIGTYVGPERCGAPPVFACNKTALAVNLPRGAKAISAGGHGLAVLDNGAVVAWGANNAGQLGNGSFMGPEVCVPSAIPCSTFPVLASTRGGVVGISAGAAFSLAFGARPNSPKTRRHTHQSVRPRKAQRERTAIGQPAGSLRHPPITTIAITEEPRI